MTNWNYIDIKERKDLTEFYWEQGYFHLNFNNKNDFVRDFEELRLRDLALFTLGDIKDKVVLDIGCGHGLYSLTFLKLGAKEVCGQDLLKDVVDYNINRCKSQGFSNFVGKAGDCANIQFEDSKFDVAFSGDVFEHISDDLKKAFLNEAFRVLKPGGYFTIKTPNKNYLKLTNFLHRIKAVLRLKNPFKIHIAHTKNNPDNEHHGLINHKNFLKILSETMFHTPTIVKTPLRRKGFPFWLSNILKNYNSFNEHIIIRVQKPIFYGIYK